MLCAGTLQYLSFTPDVDFLKLKQEAVQTGYYLPAFYSHIFASSIVLLAGFFQFSKKVYQNPRLHKALGKVYVLGILLFAAPGAYLMSYFIGRGYGVFISFMLQNTLWVTFTIAAWLQIKKGNIQGHINMMRRSYALAFAAVMLRLYIWLLSIAGVGVQFENNYLIIAFLSWLPNLIAVELINFRAKTSAKSNVILKP